jgi:ubiquinone/menaquinone biosynthesis C-methylase UbiE
MTVLTWLVVGLACILAAIAITGVIARTHAMPCPSWLRWLLDIPATRRRTFTPVLERLALRPGLRVLDLGCGYGRLTIPIARLVLPGGEVVGVDIQEAMLRIARERTEKSGLANLSFRRAAAGEGALGPGQFDRALLVTVLGEIPRQLEALREVRNVLAPGGFLSITEFLPDPHYQSVRKVRRLAAEAGLHEVAYFGNVFGYTLNLENAANH